MRHVCVVTTAHPTDDVRVNSRVARSFRDAGWHVTWVGPGSAYFTETTTPEDDFEYRLFRPNVSRIKRALARRAARARAAQVTDVDWYYAPDPDAAEVAIAVARRNGGRVLFDIHEVFHETLLDRWFPGRAPRLVRELVRRRIARTCRRADLVMGVSPSVLRPYLGAECQPVIVRNCAPRDFARERPARGSSFEGRLHVMHGKAIPSNGTMRVVEALSLLEASTQSRVCVHMVRTPAHRGGFEEAFASARKGLTDTRTILLESAIPHDKMPELLAAQDVGVIAYQRDLGVDSLPNRLFEYMAAGLAVLAPSYSSEIVSIIESERVGVHADFEDAAAIAAAVAWLVDHPAEVAAMGSRARQAFVERHNWETEFEGLVERMRGCEA